MKDVISDCPISLSWGYPDLRTLAQADLQNAFKKVGEQNPSSFLQGEGTGEGTVLLWVRYFSF